MSGFPLLDHVRVFKEVEDVIGGDHNGNAGVQWYFPSHPKPRAVANFHHRSEDLFVAV